MTRPSLVTITKRALSPGGETALPEGSTVLVAVSGGPDSMALLSTMARVAPSVGLTLVAHGVDHGLREEASTELDLAASLAAKLEIPFARTEVHVTRGGNLQERARVARWAALTTAAYATSATAIATAHHADDRAETFLMRLLRGSGARGLAALPPRAPALGAPDLTVIRPLLRARRSDVLLHLDRHRVPSAHDPSNADPRYLRARVRSRVLPLLEELDPEIVTHTSAIMDELLALTRDVDEVLTNLDEGDDRPSRTGKTKGRDWTASLPRSTQRAVRDLLRSRSKSARVWLPNGLVLGIDTRAKPARRTVKR